MRLPDRPHVGLVLSYAYLWADEAKAGQEESRKHRPTVIILARRDVGDSELVYVVPVTHSPPTKENEKVPIPAAVKRHLGLDDDASWVDVTELNVFVWPGPDLRPIARSYDDETAPCFYGFLPRGLYTRVKLALQANHRQRRVSIVKRVD